MQEDEIRRQTKRGERQVELYMLRGKAEESPERLKVENEGDEAQLGAEKK